MWYSYFVFGCCFSFQFIIFSLARKMHNIMYMLLQNCTQNNKSFLITFESIGLRTTKSKQQHTNVTSDVFVVFRLSIFDFIILSHSNRRLISSSTRVRLFKPMLFRYIVSIEHLFSFSDSSKLCSADIQLGTRHFNVYLDMCLPFSILFRDFLQNKYKFACFRNYLLFFENFNQVFSFGKYFYLYFEILHRIC